MTAYPISLNPVTDMTDEQFYQLCGAKPEVKFKRSPLGELIITAATGGKTGSLNYRQLNHSQAYVEISLMNIDRIKLSTMSQTVSPRVHQ